ncbi:hypothetical protein [Niabella hibiscisoli]|uniref:hypothetical protein n=1 Tax=Niabella hibiscisoli TaxID=1825928 RepID=UPI001F0E1E3D|nr:hypothetical protein [Niabella hibiscisoli]MCH5715885.1 hypothetical protein [Niabella hibiscisoli]
MFYFIKIKKGIFYKFADFYMRAQMKLIIGCLIAFAIMSFAHAQTGSGKQAFYNALASNSAAVWNKQLEAVNTLPGNDKSAFQGALLMRKSALRKRRGKNYPCLSRDINCWRQLLGRRVKMPNTGF